MAIAGIINGVIGGVTSIIGGAQKKKQLEVQRDIIGIQGKNNLLALGKQKEIAQIQLEGNMYQSLMQARLSGDQVKIAAMNNASKSQMYMVFGVIGLIGLIIFMKNRN